MYMARFAMGEVHLRYRGLLYIANESALRFAWSPSIIGLVVEFVVAIDEARVRFTDDALLFLNFSCIVVEQK
ncbi:hypothetical protein N7519_009144 [Penicillium mononematosum]|uniref:uncharacterized protein n=1 Tax=Penicillium mononematosum TaxID=268346 RepID=UPI0025472F76|nr:uncharacterized protein N7519_009144 [Penicillium mononematosum]KAJ6178683.1 hypothetical protein N7519_009144 [Penicillium mononematosum]